MLFSTTTPSAHDTPASAHPPTPLACKCEPGGGVLFTSQQHTTTTTTITNIQPTANDTAEAATAPAPAGMGRTTTTTNGGGGARAPDMSWAPATFFLPYLFCFY